jgi:hypothetical protein
MLSRTDGPDPALFASRPADRLPLTGVSRRLLAANTPVLEAKALWRCALQIIVLRATVVERCRWPDRGCTARKGVSMNTIVSQMFWMRSVGRKSTQLLFCAEGHVR